jgi:cell division cycle 20-like protein 1 (cofactor of APC complex)
LNQNSYDRYIPNSVQADLFALHLSDHTSLKKFSSKGEDSNTEDNNPSSLNKVLIEKQNSMNYQKLLQSNLVTPRKKNFEGSQGGNSGGRVARDGALYLGNLSGRTFRDPNSTGLKGRSDQCLFNSTKIERKLFSFSKQKENLLDDILDIDSSNSLVRPYRELYTSEEEKSEKIREISNFPYKVLDAPGMPDDFYMNILDWSSCGKLFVALQNCVYTWCPVTNQASKLFSASPNEHITCLKANQDSSILSIAHNSGVIKLMDLEKATEIRQMHSQKARVACVDWKDHMLASGSKDKNILVEDVRTGANEKNFQEIVLEGHRQEVCGLKWSMTDPYLASGGNDNKFMIWETRMAKRLKVFNDHQAAVKSVCWNPHNRNIVMSGGGTNDKCIKIWNLNNFSLEKSIDTESQVCNLAFSRHSNEFVSTHGYSGNQIMVWKYSGFQKIAILTGHSSRVLHLAMSPKGNSIVTGAGDETLRFWDIFPSKSEEICPKISDRDDNFDYKLVLR